MLKQTEKIVPLITCEVRFLSICLQIDVWCPHTWFLILGARLILSNNQSKATLWVLDTCLIVGLRPFIIILITASLSSKTENIALEPACVTLDGTWSILVRSRLVCMVAVTLYHLWCCWIALGKNTSLTKSQRSRAGIPSMRKPASREITSASVELCETEVCFLHIQLVGTNVWRPKIHKTPPDVDFESSRSPAKSESWNSPNLHCLAVFPTWQYCLYSLVWWM